jgi:hypothetical protein
MFFSVLVGTSVYIFAQFTWYSPWAFGPAWSRLQKKAPSKMSDPVALPSFVTPNVRRILLPALIVSISLHVFRVMTAGFGLGVFFLGTSLLWFLVVIGKYLRKNGDPAERQKCLIEDGALLWSLSLVAVSVAILGE